MRLFTLFISVLFFSGCSVVTHAQQLLTLQAYSDNKKVQEAYVHTQDKKFDALVAAIHDGSIGKYKTQQEFVKAFGDPVIILDVEKDGVSCQQWLYRYAVKFQNAEKAYLYFDKAGLIQKYEYVPAAQTAGQGDPTNDKNQS